MPGRKPAGPVAVVAAVAVAPLVVWVSTIGYGCLTDWVAVGSSGVQLGEAINCFRTLFLVSVPLSLATFAMLRHVARLRLAAVTITGGLAVAGIASAALSLFHPPDASLMVLIWNVGMAGAVVAVDVLVARCLFRTGVRHQPNFK